MEKKIKILILLFISIIISAILHNAIYAIFNFEEPVFFILTLLFTLAFVVFLVYLIISHIIEKFTKKRSKKTKKLSNKKKKKFL